ARAPARLFGGPPRTAPAAPAVPGCLGTICVPDGGEQRRIDCQCAADHAQRRGLVPLDGKREIAWVHAIFAVRTCDSTRPIRSAAGYHVARVARVRGRCAGGTPAEVLDAGRFVDADSDRRTSRRATG